jgi:MFS transporter, AAHS family, benzoate transport protein
MSPGNVGRDERLVIGLCFVVIVFDGYDLIVYGATVPALLTYAPWGLTPTTVGAIGSYALVGMLAGALLAGVLTDIVGRRRVMIAGVAWFSVAMAGCAMARNPEVFGVFRLLGGIGLGGVMPTAIALTAEYSRPHRRSFNNAVMFSGYAVGGILAALLALALMPANGFRPMYWIGVLPLVTVVPLLVRHLPESMTFLAMKGRLRGTEPRKAGLSVLFTRRHLVPAVLFAITSFFGLLLIYGLNTWLPQIMKTAGYPLTSSLLFLVVMNVGAVVGSLLVAPIGDRIGMRPVTGAAFLAAAVSIYLLHTPMAAPLMYALVAVAGFGTIGCQILVNAYVAMHFPDEVRATALGATLGIGRLGAIVGPTFGGLLLASDLEVAWNFYAFAIPAAVGALVVFLLPGRTADRRVRAPAGQLA